MNTSTFDKAVDNIVVGSNKKKVSLVAFLALFSALVCISFMIYGAFYQLELKIKATGTVNFDEARNLFITATIPDKFFGNLNTGNEVIVRAKEREAEYGGFRIEEISEPIPERSRFDVRIGPDSAGIMFPFQDKEQVDIVIIYKRVSVLKVLLTKDN